LPGNSVEAETSVAARPIILQLMECTAQILHFVVIDVRISGLLLADEIISLDLRFIVKLNPQLTSNNAD